MRLHQQELRQPSQEFNISRAIIIINLIVTLKIEIFSNQYQTFCIKR